MKVLAGLFKSPTFVVGFAILVGTVSLGVMAPFLLHRNPYVRVGLPFMPPSATHRLGTDHLGRDMLSLLAAGLRSSLFVGFVAGTVATTLGTFIGVYGGYVGGWVDDVLTAATNLFLVIPSLIVLVLLSSSLERGRSLLLIALIIGSSTWTWSARAVRAQTSSIRAREHVALARLNGYGTVEILLLHILPYLLSYVFMVFILQTAEGILAEASISMLGLGPYDSVSLGKILNEAIRNEALADGAWWAFAPAVALITSVAFSLYVLNTSMEAVFNPRLRK